MSVLDSIAATLRAEGRSDAEVYGILLGQFVGTPYLWGGSGVLGSDCSGSVCACLSRVVGKPVRVTADELYRNWFTVDAPGVDSLDGKLAAAFFLDKDGRAIHVSGHMGQGLFLNASSIEDGRRAAPRTWEELLSMYGSFVPALRVCRAACPGKGGKGVAR